MARSLWLALFVIGLGAWGAGSARADLPGPGPSPSVNRHIPAPQPAPPQPPTDPLTGRPMWDFQEEKKPRRSGPFRSCGSGAGAGLAGIGLAWGALWLGNRFARSQRARG